jgi:hypothetical protein
MFFWEHPLVILQLVFIKVRYCMFIESLIHRLFKGLGGEKWQNIGGMVSLICPGCDWK